MTDLPLPLSRKVAVLDELASNRNACEGLDNAIADRTSFVRNDEKFIPLPRRGIKAAFTLAEVLITLAIIGVVAVLTIPTLIQKTNDKQYNSARHAILTRFNDALRLMSINNELTSASNAEDFVKNYLSKYMKIAEFGTTHPDKIIAINGKQKNKFVFAQRGYSPTQYGFVLNNGYTVYLYYNPKCIEDCLANCYAANTVCVNAIYDMNGLKGPNKAGKDIGFITAFYPDKTMVFAPLLHNDLTQTGTFNGAVKYVSN